MQPYPLHGRQVHVVVNRAAARLQRGYGCHFRIRQREVEDMEILRHPFPAHGLGDDHDVALVEPAKHDRPHAFTVPCSDFFQHRVIENVVLPFGERSPCFMLDALLLQKRIGGFPTDSQQVLPHCAEKDLAIVRQKSSSHQ